MKIQSFKNKNTQGYTIIETMIAISLFLVIIISGMGVFLNANVLHQKAQNMRSIMDNMSFITEEMSRNLRTGYRYYCITGSDSLSNVSTAKSGQSCWGVAFEPDTGNPADQNDQWVYYIGPDTSLPGNPGGIWRSTAGPYSASSFIKLTPDEVSINVTASGFSVLGAESPIAGNTQQPFVVIRLVGSVTYKNVVTPFSLQTSVSQRLIDV